MTHLLLLQHNPTLRKDPPVGTVGSGYQCFQVNYTVQDVWNYQMGCTYADNRICKGWKLNTQCASVPAKAVVTTTTVPSSSGVLPVSTSQKPNNASSTTLIPANRTNRSTTMTMVPTTTKMIQIAKNTTESPKTTQRPVKSNRESHSDAKAYTIAGEFIALALAATIWNAFFVHHLW
uniref:Uncharacterized protein n=1 Tax=Anopheles albimanus TaxID=7167 RepID=A0A1Y9G856_ANOAL